MPALLEHWWSRDSSCQRRDCYRGINWQASLKKSSQALRQGENWVRQSRHRTQHLGAAAATGGKNVLSIGCFFVTSLCFALIIFSWWLCQLLPGFTFLAETKVALFYLRKDHSSALDTMGFHLAGIGLCFLFFLLLLISTTLAPLCKTGLQLLNHHSAIYYFGCYNFCPKSPETFRDWTKMSQWLGYLKPDGSVVKKLLY